MKIISCKLTPTVGIHQILQNQSEVVYNKSLMTATGHALVATLIAAKFHNPYIALPLSFVSHFVCDAIPHWDEGTHWREKSRKDLLYESVFDVSLSIVVSMLSYSFLFHQQNYIFLLVNVFLSQLPDYITAPYLIFRNLGPFTTIARTSYELQHRLNRRLDKPMGIITTAATVIGVYLVLFRIF